jgi:hypothetical protein
MARIVHGVADREFPHPDGGAFVRQDEPIELDLDDEHDLSLARYFDEYGLVEFDSEIPSESQAPSAEELAAEQLPTSGEAALDALVDISEGSNGAHAGDLLIASAADARRLVLEGKAVPAAAQVPARLRKVPAHDLRKRAVLIDEQQRHCGERVELAQRSHAKAKELLRGKDPTSPDGQKAARAVLEAESEVRLAEIGLESWSEEHAQERAELAIALKTAERRARQEHWSGAFDAAEKRYDETLEAVVRAAVALNDAEYQARAALQSFKEVCAAANSELGTGMQPCLQIPDISLRIDDVRVQAAHVGIELTIANGGRWIARESRRREKTA